MKLVIVFIAFLSFFSSETETEKFTWSEERKLRWTDFRGVPNRSEGYVASTNSGISFSFSYKHSDQGRGKLTFKVKSNFYPKLSWYRPGRVNDYILKHEQTHFDISELHARKLRKRLSNLPYSEEYKFQSKAIYQQIENERRSMQEQFDEDSQHSNVREAEYQWEYFVSQELQKYERWR